MLPISYTISITSMLLLAVILAIILRRYYRVYWILFVVGCLTFVGAQIVHLPLNEWLADIGLLPQDPGLNGAPLWRSALILGLTAGLCEELARAVGYLIVKWARRFEDGVMLGLGHGGIEAMIFGGVLTAATISSLLNLEGVDLESMGLSSAQIEAVSIQLAQFNSSPIFGFVPLLERTFAIGAQVLLSVIVLQAFTRKNPVYIILAIGYHAIIDAAAVYAAVSTESIWISWAAFLVLLIPGWIWLARLWRSRNQEIAESEEEPPHPGAITQDFSLFIASLKKEFLFQWRSWRVLIVCAVMLAFGIMSPLITKFTPQLLSSLEGAEMFADLIPEMGVTDSLNQHIETITQFGFILTILLGMGAVAGEKARGSAAMILSKPLSRVAFLNSKYIAQVLLFFLGIALTTGGGYYYNTILFGSLGFSVFVKINLLLLLMLLVFAAITLLGSSLGNSTGAGGGISLGLAIVFLLAGSIPRLGQLLPAGLLAWAGQIAGLAESTSNWGSVTMSLVIILVCLIAAWGVFERQEL